MSANNFPIRKFKEEDEERLVEIALKAWVPIFDYYRETMEDDLFFSVFPDWKSDKARQIRTACDPSNNILVFVSELNNKIAGFITLVINRKDLFAEISNNAVDPDYQGKGIGADQYKYCINLVQKMGLQYIKVWTGGDPAHAPARRAYEKAGFSVGLPVVQYYKKL